MDSFIKIVEQKKEEPVTTLHTQHIDLLQKYIRERKNVFICGASGVGKTYILQSVLNENNSVEIQREHLKSKSNFLAFIKNTGKHAFIDDYDCEFKPIVERVADGERLTRGSLVVTSVNMCMFPNFETIFVMKPTIEKLISLIGERTPKIENAAIQSHGNIRNFLSYVDGYDVTDVFKTPKEFITDILTDAQPIKIHDSISEHGHLWDIFQENYLDSKGVHVNRVASAFSDADVYDSHIYSSGDWNLMPYFVLNALTIPKTGMGTPLIREKIRPGSCWTKYGNYKMRNQKYKEIQKKSKTGLYIDELCLLKKYAETGNVLPMVEYNLSPQDFDVINHLAVGSKLKQRDVTKVKKALKNAIEKSC